MGKQSHQHLREDRRRPDQRRAASRPFAGLEGLEARRMFSVGDLLQLPAVFLDIPGTAAATNASPGVKRLDIRTSATTVVNTAGTTGTLAPPAIVDIAIFVNNNGTLNGGVAGDDLRVYQDHDTSGGFNAGDTLLLSGDVRPAGFVASGVTLEFVFAVTGGAWATDPLFFKPPASGGGGIDAGIQLDFTVPGGGPISFASEFAGYQPKGILGALPFEVEQEKPASLCGRVFSDCDDDGLFESGDKGIAGVIVSLINQANDTVVQQVVTGADGTYQFENIAPGTYTVVEGAVPPKYLDGKDTPGKVGGATRGTALNDRIESIVLNAGDNAFGYHFAEVEASSLSGYVYADANCNGAIDSFDGAIAGVTITLKNSAGQKWTTVTDADGFYKFAGVRPGTYSIAETQPSGITNGDTDAGTLGGSASDAASCVSSIKVKCGQDGACYNFGENASGIKSGQTTTVAWWKGAGGVAFIKSLNGGPAATQLGNWLATNFPNLFGALAGKTNADVADHFVAKAASSSNALYVKILGTALSVYTTDKQLAGTAGALLGVRIDDVGLAAATVSLGSNAAAFGFSSNTKTTVLQLLRRADSYAWNGLPWDKNKNGTIDSSGAFGVEKTHASMASTIFSLITK